MRRSTRSARASSLAARVASTVDEDAAAGGGDLLVGRAGQALAELLLPAAGPRQVGVGVDEAGDDGAAAAVEAGNVRQLADAPAPILRRADEGDPAVAAVDLGAGGAGDPAQVGAGARRGAVGGGDLGEVVDQELGHQGSLLPNNAVPTRTWVAPSSTAIS